jgi:transaldolase
MKIFLDTANLDELRRADNMGILDGVTTNPTLISKENGTFEGIIDEITKLVKGPVSVEVTSRAKETMIEEGRRYSRLAPNVVVKVPMTEEGLTAMKVLTKEKIKINVTLIFSANQALLAAKAGATYVSPFVGRMDDIGYDGMQVVRDAVQILGTYKFETNVLAASIRHPLHVIEAAKAGAHVATLPFSVLEKLITHPLTESGEKRFLDDWKKVRSLKV